MTRLLHIAAANRAFDAAVTEDDHLAAVMARDRSMRSDYGSDGERLTLAFELSEFRVYRHDGDAFYRTRPRISGHRLRLSSIGRSTSARACECSLPNRPVGRREPAAAAAMFITARSMKA